MTGREDSGDLIKGLNDYDERCESEREEVRHIIYNEALGSLEKTLMSPALEFEGNHAPSLPVDVTDEHVDVFVSSSRMDYHSKFNILFDSFGYLNDSREIKLTDVKYAETTAGLPAFIFEAEGRFEVEDSKTHDIKVEESVYLPLLVEINEDIVLMWFSKLVRPERQEDIKNIVSNKERKRVLDRARRFGEYLNIVDCYKKGYLPEY